MPGPQAADLLAADDPAAAASSAQRWDPVLTVVAAYDERCWHEFDAMFVNDSAVLGFVADDGRRRGDDAPVLVAHSGAVLAAGHLDDPASASGALLEALEHAVGATAKPTWFDVRRWSLAKPRRQQPAPYSFDGVVGLCGDVWGDGPRVEAAWTVRSRARERRRRSTGLTRRRRRCRSAGRCGEQSLTGASAGVTLSERRG